MVERQFSRLSSSEDFAVAQVDNMPVDGLQTLDDDQVHFSGQLGYMCHLIASCVIIIYYYYICRYFNINLTLSEWKVDPQRLFRNTSITWHKKWVFHRTSGDSGLELSWHRIQRGPRVGRNSGTKYAWFGILSGKSMALCFVAKSCICHKIMVSKCVLNNTATLDFTPNGSNRLD